MYIHSEVLSYYFRKYESTFESRATTYFRNSYESTLYLRRYNVVLSYFRTLVLSYEGTFVRKYFQNKYCTKVQYLFTVTTYEGTFVPSKIQYKIDIFVRKYYFRMYFLLEILPYNFHCVYCTRTKVLSYKQRIGSSV